MANKDIMGLREQIKETATLLFQGVGREESSASNRSHNERWDAFDLFVRIVDKDIELNDKTQRKLYQAILTCGTGEDSTIAAVGQGKDGLIDAYSSLLDAMSRWVTDQLVRDKFHNREILCDLEDWVNLDLL